MNRIKKGDKVVILAGKSKGGQGEIVSVLGDKVIVSGQNVYTKHEKPNPNQQKQGGIVKKEMPLHVSNVGLVNPSTNKADRVGFRFEELSDGTSVKKRYFKSDNSLVDA